METNMSNKQLTKAREAAAVANQGNDYSSKSKRMITSTLNRVLTQDDGIRARNIAEALVTKAENGDISAIKEILDRTEGKIMAQNHVTAEINNNQPIYVITGIDDNDTIESLDDK